MPTTPYMYVSLESIATLGLGDLARVTDSDASRCSEAVIGQVFLVTFVAMIVSRFDFGAGRGCTPGTKSTIKRRRTTSARLSLRSRSAWRSAPAGGPREPILIPIGDLGGPPVKAAALTTLAKATPGSDGPRHTRSNPP